MPIKKEGMATKKGVWEKSETKQERTKIGVERFFDL